MFSKSPALSFLTLILIIGTGCSREVRTVDDLVRVTGHKLESARVWQTKVHVRFTRPNHVSEWEGVIYSDGGRYAAIMNGASGAGRIQSHLVIDGDQNGWLRVTGSGDSRVVRFDPRQALPAGTGPDSFLLPGNPATGNPLGMFLDPARALRVIEASYDLRLTRRTQVQGDPVLGFTGTMKPEVLEQIDPNRYLAEHALPIQNIDVTVRLYDGAPRRIQFMDQGNGYLLIEYTDTETDPDFMESRFEFKPGPEVESPIVSAADTVAGVDTNHVLFAWDETRRVLPPTD